MTQENFGVRYLKRTDIFVIYEITPSNDASARRPDIEPISVVSARDEIYAPLKLSLIDHIQGLGMFEAIRYYNVATDHIDYIVNPSGNTMYKIHGRDIESLKSKDHHG